MKLNQLFKLLIDIAYFMLIPVILLFPGAILYALIFPDQKIIKLTTGTLTVGSWETALILIIVYAEYALFFVGFYNLRKFATQLLKNKIFTKASIESAKRIGQFFSVCGISALILKLIFVLFLSNEFRVGFGISDTQLFLFLTIIGMFFLILSSAFERALQLEEEHKLTV